MRHQYGHAIDMVPTVLDLLGIDPPDSIKGIEQSDMHGVSLKSTIDDAHATQEHTVQYFEMFGCRSIYKDGWRAECGWPGPDYATGPRTATPSATRSTPQISRPSRRPGSCST